MDTKHIIIIAVLLVILAILSTAIILTIIQPAEALEIDDINLEQDQFGIFQIVGHITPLKDFDYLEARITFYDENGVIIGQSSCAWNAAHVQKDTKLSLGNGIGGICDGTPAYAVISFYDSVYSDTPLANATITFNITNTTNSNDDSSSSSLPSTNNDNKYTDSDLDAARQEGYADGYSDGAYDSYDYPDYSDSYSSDSYDPSPFSSSDSQGSEV